MAKDFIEEMVEEFTARDPDFPRLFEDAQARRAKLRELATKRMERGFSQTEVAARMGTSQSVVARIESGDVDVKLSTLEKYAAAIGARFTWNVALVTARS